MCRQRGVRAERPADFEAVDDRQHEVEHQEIGSALLGDRERIHAVAPR